MFEEETTSASVLNSSLTSDEKGKYRVVSNRQLRWNRTKKSLAKLAVYLAKWPRRGYIGISTHAFSKDILHFSIFRVTHHTSREHSAHASAMVKTQQ